MNERVTPSPEHLREASARIPVFNVRELEDDPRYVIAEGPRTSHPGGIGIVLETYVEYRLYKFSDQYKSPWRMGVEGVDLKVTEKRAYRDQILESDIDTYWGNGDQMYAALVTEKDSNGQEQQILLLKERTDIETLG